MNGLPFSLLIILLCSPVSDASYFEIKLLKDLFKDYRKDMRPVLNDSDVVNVTIGLSLSQIINVNEKQQVMTASVWTRQEWYNPYLKWNKIEYGNITTINVPSSNLWLPDLVLYNNADESIDFRGNLDQLSTRVQLFNDGTNKWLAPVMLRSKCVINVEYFPFDSQTCTMKFGSWTYDGYRVNVTRESDNVDIGKYVKSAEWHLESAPVKRHEIKYFCCPQPYPDITFYFNIQRRTLFYLSNLILPLVVISILITFVFTLPPESGERISLSITILLAMTVFMLLVTGNMPATSEVVPLIAKFYTAVMVEMALALMVTCYVLRCYHSPAKAEVPRLLRKYMVGKLANFFGVKKSKALLEKEAEQSYHNNGINALLEKMTENQMKRTDDVAPREKGVREEKQGNIEDPIGEKMLEKLEIIANDVEAKGEEDLIMEQWHVLAKVVDRLAFYSFAVIIAATIIVVFSQSPGYVP